ncbi:hypothetical protein ACUOCP_07570 [Escherichia sp. R-CC3]
MPHYKPGRSAHQQLIGYRQQKAEQHQQPAPFATKVCQRHDPLR